MYKITAAPKLKEIKRDKKVHRILWLDQIIDK